MARFDHAMANVQALYTFQDAPCALYIVNEQSWFWLLREVSTI